MYINDLTYFQDKVIDCLGDSTTWGNNGIDGGSQEISWVHGLDQLIPFKEVRNYGKRGSQVTVNHGRDDSFIERLAQMKIADADYLVIFGGINDFRRSVPLGQFAEDNTDRYSFAGAYNFLVRHLLSHYPHLTVIIMTPAKINGHKPQYPTSRRPNQRDLRQEDYVNVIKQVAHFYSLPVIDLFNNSGISPFIPANAQFMPDGLHYSRAGYLRLQRRIASQLLNYL